MTLTDLRFAWRMLVRNGTTSVVAAGTLALAIGGTTAIFSVVYGVLLRPLPYPEPDRLVAIWEVTHEGNYSRLADPNFDDFRERTRTFEAMAKYGDRVTSVSGGEAPVRATVTYVTRDFFDVLGVRPVIGRSFEASDARVGAEPTIVVGHRLWTAALTSAPALDRLQLTIDNRVFRVIGVMPAGFEFPARADVWVPAELDPPNRSRTSHNFLGIGRLASGVTPADAATEMSTIARDIIATAPEQGEYLMADATAVPLRASLTRRVGSTLSVLLGSALFLMLIATANVANLLTARALARQRELSIRRAVGAGMGRLVWQFIAEALVLVALGGLGGLALASTATDAMLALAPADLPRLDEVSMNGTVLTFALGLSAAVAVALGLFTAWRAVRRNPREQFDQAARKPRLGSFVVGLQMALTVVLLVGASLLGRSLLRVLAVHPGFRTDGIVAMDVALPADESPDATARLAPFYVNLFDRLRAAPGVDDVGVASAVPFDGGLPDGQFVLLGPGERPMREDLPRLFERQDRLGTADYCAVSPAYFGVLGVPLVSGRLFDARDGADAPHVALVNEALAKARWPDANPIGALIEFGNMDGDMRPLTVVGIVGDTRENGPDEPPRPTLYVDFFQRPRSAATVVIRTDAPLASVTSAARRVLRDLAPGVPPRVRSFREIHLEALGARYFTVALVGIFGGTALLLAMAGMYGVMAHSVARQRKDIGVRMALGASRARVLRGIVGRGLATTVVGVAAGGICAAAASRSLTSMLFGITPTDPAAFALAATSVTIVAGLACYLPARRAASVDPSIVLREQ
ncbi:MAG: ABC transporter permease [Vicinamibacterales bacterium]